MSEGLLSDDPDDEPDPGRLLFEFVRYWSRRNDGPVSTRAQGRLVIVTQAAHTVSLRRAATVNAIADEIGIDQSGASRLIKDAIDAGYLEVGAVGIDARRRRVSVTPAGTRMLAQAHEWQEAVFEELTDSWSTRQRRDFARGMRALLHASHGRTSGC